MDITIAHSGKKFSVTPFAATPEDCFVLSCKEEFQSHIVHEMTICEWSVLGQPEKITERLDYLIGRMELAISMLKSGQQLPPSYVTTFEPVEAGKT